MLGSVPWPVDAYPGARRTRTATRPGSGSSRRRGGCSETLKALRGAPGPVRERLAGYFAGVVDKSCQMQRDVGRVLGCDIGTVACELAPVPGTLQPRLRDVMRRWCRALERLIDDGRADGSLDPELEPRAAAETVLALIQGMSVLGRTFDRPVMLARIAEQALRLLPPPPA